MSTQFIEILQELRKKGIPLRKFQAWLRMQEMTDSLTQEGLQLVGLKEWLNQAPEIFLHYQEKPEHRCNLRDLQDWLNQNLITPTKKITILDSSLTEKTSSLEPDFVQVETPPLEKFALPISDFLESVLNSSISDSSFKEALENPSFYLKEKQDEEDWDTILKELENFEENIPMETLSEVLNLSGVQEFFSDEEKQEKFNTSEQDPLKKKETRSKEAPDFSYYLKRKEDIQGPYHFTRVLRYIREGRLPKPVQFSLSKENWRDLEFFPHKEEFTEIQLNDSVLSETNEAIPVKMESKTKTSQTKKLTKKSLTNAPEIAPKKESAPLTPSEKKPENTIPEEFWLRLKNDIQGPYHYTRILRYIREGRLSQSIEFSSDTERWEELDFFPYSLEEETASGAVRIDLIQTVSHKKHETGILNMDEGSYEGEMEEGLPHGHGKIAYPDKSSYAGGFRNGKFSGRGFFTFPDGGSYEGDWQEGNMHGLGKMIDSNGNIYNGRWVHGDQTGLGALTNKEGASYVGEFKQGKFHGRGSYTWPTGQVYVGEFHEGEFHGEGILTIASLFGKKTQAGLWEDGEYLGPTKEFAEATKTYKREARLGNKLAQKRLKELGIKWHY